MRFGDLLVFNGDFWGCRILGFDWEFVRFCPNGSGEDFGVNFGEFGWLVESIEFEILGYE